MGSEYTEIDEEFRYRFRYHRTTTVGVDGVRRAVVAVDGVVEEIFRHDRVLRCGDQPSGDIAGINIQDDIAFVPAPFHGSLQCGDVPRPHLVRAAGDQPGPDPGGMAGP